MTDGADAFDVFNPATGRVLATLACNSADHIARTVEAAHPAQARWGARSPGERALHLRKAATRLEQEADALARLVVQENGKTFAQARFGDVAACIGMFRFFADLVEQRRPAVRALGPIESEERLCPLGVIAGIIPFNWPPIHFGGKVAPALAAGNAIVLKPGEQAPLAIMRMSELVGEVLPDAVLHCVVGRGAAGQCLIEHPLVRKVSFTGAPSTGVHVLQSAARNLTPSLLELGGKNPFVICHDADLDLALADALEGAFVNKGEACTAASRILVDRRVHDVVRDRLARAVADLRLGSGMDSATDVGPLVSAAQAERVRQYIAIGRDEDGATIAAQSALPTDASLAGGYFVPATLFADVTPGMRIAREEIFGPVTCLIPFDSEDEALRIANDVDFGLVASVYTRDTERAERFAAGIAAGMVMINNYNRNFMGSPFGGIKASGFGREHCIQTLEEFSYIKTVRRAVDQAALVRWPRAAELIGRG